jgi:hypothetical protein
MGGTFNTNTRISTMHENHLGQGRGQKASGKAKPWIDGVMRDAERLGITNWRIKAMDIKGWRRFLESAKTLHGL